MDVGHSGVCLCSQCPLVFYWHRCNTEITQASVRAVTAPPSGSSRELRPTTTKHIFVFNFILILYKPDCNPISLARTRKPLQPCCLQVDNKHRPGCYSSIMIIKTKRTGLTETWTSSTTVPVISCCSDTLITLQLILLNLWSRAAAFKHQSQSSIKLRDDLYQEHSAQKTESKPNHHLLLHRESKQSLYCERHWAGTDLDTVSSQTRPGHRLRKTPRRFLFKCDKYNVIRADYSDLLTSNFTELDDSEKKQKVIRRHNTTSWAAAGHTRSQTDWDKCGHGLLSCSCQWWKNRASGTRTRSREEKSGLNCGLKNLDFILTSPPNCSNHTGLHQTHKYRPGVETSLIWAGVGGSQVSLMSWHRCQSSSQTASD